MEAGTGGGRASAISPAAVDQALFGHPDVVDVATFSLPDAAFGEEVAAAVVLRDGAAATDEQLRRFARAALGANNGLRQVLVVDGIPADASGQRQSCALVDILSDRLRARYVPPRTNTERLLAGWWSDILGVDDIGLMDDFFQLGGDSIKAMLVCSRARTARLRLEAIEFAEHPTLEGLAAVAMPLPSSLAETHDEALGSCPLLPLQHYYFTNVFDHGVPLPFVALESRVPYDADALRRAAAHLVAHHEGLRTRFERIPDGPIQVFDGESGAVQIDTIDLSHVPQADRPSAFDAQLPPAESWSLTRGPVVRFVRVRLGDDGERLVILAHHIVADRVAMGVLAEDFKAAYDQIAAGEPVAVPPKATSIRAWVRHRRVQTASGGYAREMDRLEKIRGVPPIPADASCQGAQRGRSLTVDATVMRRVSMSAARWRVLPSAVFAAAFARAWAGCRHRHAVVLSYLLSGRRDVPPGFDLSRTVACLAVAAPILMNVDADSTLETLSRMLHEQLVDSERYPWLSDRLPHENIPNGAVQVTYRIVKPSPLPAGVPPIAKPLFSAAGQIDRLQSISSAVPADEQARPDSPFAGALRFRIRVGMARTTLAFMAVGLSHETIDEVLLATRETLELGLTRA
jgi:hypothetical protein